MNIPETLRYTKTHEWARRAVAGEAPHAGGEITVGITDYAQTEITDVVHVELPRAGRKVEAGKPIAVVESVKAAFDIYAPVTGEVVRVNDELASHPELVNQHPYDGGWFFVIKPSDPAAWDKLLTAADYKKHLESPKT